MSDTLLPSSHEGLSAQSVPGDVDTQTAAWSTSRRVALLVLLCAVTATSLMDRQIISILITPIKHEFGATDAQMGLLTGLAFAAVYVVAGFPLASWADNGNRRTVLAVSLAMWSVMTMLCGATRSFGQLAAARMGLALGEAGCNPASHSIIADLFSKRERAKAIGFFNASGAIGVSLGLFAGGTLVSHFDWRTVFVIIGAPGLVLAVIVKFAAHEPLRGMADARRTNTYERTALRKRLGSLSRHRTFRRLTFSAAACAFVNYGLSSWSAAFFMRVHHLTPAVVGTKLALVSVLGLLAGTIGAGMLTDRCSRSDLRWAMRIAGVGMLGALPSGALFLLTPNVNVGFISYGFAICLSAAWATPIYALTQTVAPVRMRGLASAVVAFFLNVAGYGLAPFVVGKLSDVFLPAFGEQSLRYALLVLVATSVGAALICFGANRYLLADCEAAERT